MKYLGFILAGWVLFIVLVHVPYNYHKAQALPTTQVRAPVTKQKPSDDIPLQLEGDKVKTIKVDKVIVVKVDKTIVTGFPFNVTAPSGHALYFWQYPPTTKAQDRGHTLVITKAPDGELTVSVKVVSIDWDAKKFTTKFGELTFSIGMNGKPPPKDPPVSPLVKALRKSYKVDEKAASDLGQGTAFASHFSKWRRLFETFGIELDKAYNRGSVKTEGDARQLFADARHKNGVRGMQAMSKVITEYLDTNAPFSKQRKLTTASVANIARVYGEVGAAMRKVP